MKKTLLIAAAATLSFGASSVVSAGNIETAERYSAPLEQNVVGMDVSATETTVVDAGIAETELWDGDTLHLHFRQNAEINELGTESSPVKSAF